MKMNRQQRALQLSLLLSILVLNFACAIPIEEKAEAAKPIKPASSDTEDPLKLGIITEDVIPDVENTTQKVIRVNPLDLPAISEDKSDNEDSSLYKIQSLMPANRRYVNSNHMRGTKKRTKDSVPSSELESPIIRQQITEPKFQKPNRNHKKPLNFIYNQNALNGHDVNKAMQVHLAPGAYPVYYVISRTNGRFGKHPLKSFRTPTEFLKYLTKNKVASKQSES